MVTVGDLCEMWEEISKHVDDYDWYWIMSLDDSFIPDLNMRWFLLDLFHEEGIGL